MNNTSQHPALGHILCPWRFAVRSSMTAGMAILEIRGIIRCKWKDNTPVPGAQITETRNVYVQYRDYFLYLKVAVELQSEISNIYGRLHDSWLDALEI